jgi:AraC family transcriptional regulator of adaptative response / DNA-3-methyladenine glycosylase II
VLLAKQLIQETPLPMTAVALAAGFGSIRRFNETFQQLYGRPPGALRSARAAAAAATSTQQDGITLRLRYRAPYDWDAMRDHLAARAVAGVEQVEGDVYRRTAWEDGQPGTVEVRHDVKRQSLVATVRLPNIRALPAVLLRVRRVFDVGADIEAIAAHLARDPLLAPLVARRPGLRAPGAWDGFELAVRAVLGQQVTVAAARTLAGRLVALCGAPLPEGCAVPGALTHAFPTPERVAAADLSQLGLPGSRRATLHALARAAAADPDLFRPLGTTEDAIARLRAIPGVGEWTAQYIALRALRETDAFPASDLGLLRGAARGTRRPTPEGLRRRSEPWRPWRAYAAQHLWTADAVRSREVRRG